MPVNWDKRSLTKLTLSNKFRQIRPRHKHSRSFTNGTVWVWFKIWSKLFQTEAYAWISISKLCVTNWPNHFRVKNQVLYYVWFWSESQQHQSSTKKFAKNDHQPLICIRFKLSLSTFVLIRFWQSTTPPNLWLNLNGQNKTKQMAPVRAVPCKRQWVSWSTHCKSLPHIRNIFTKFLLFLIISFSWILSFFKLTNKCFYQSQGNLLQSC